MAGGYDVTPVDPLDVLRDQLVSLKERVAELERPTGTQLYASLRNPVFPSVGSASASGFLTSTSWTTHASVGLTVPDGYTRALIYASGALNIGTNNGGGDRMFGRVVISGAAGPSSKAVGNLVEALAAFSTASLTGLISGGNVQVDLQSSLAIGPGNTFETFANLTVQAMFLR